MPLGPFKFMRLYYPSNQIKKLSIFYQLFQHLQQHDKIIKCDKAKEIATLPFKIKSLKKFYLILFSAALFEIKLQ